jgi:2-methylisocitrate lyase-like PEP mutase family enzyme
MTTAVQAAKFQTFQRLHQRDGVFVIPNPWDAGSARILTALGFEALATTSAGYAFSAGLQDSPAVLKREAVLANARAIVAATHLPVSADLQNGFGPIRRYARRQFVWRLMLGWRVARLRILAGILRLRFMTSGTRLNVWLRLARACDFVLTARAENYLWARPDLEDTIRRLQGFSLMGADVLFAPGLRSIEDIRMVCGAVGKPVNVVMGLQGASYSVDELGAAGVKRISVGGSFARAALGALLRAAKEVKDRGTFTYAEDALPHFEASAYMSDVAADELS